MNYQVRRESATELQEAVDAFLNQGWEPLGGVAVSIAYSHYQDRNDGLASTETVTWAQAIRRRSPTEPEGL